MNYTTIEEYLLSNKYFNHPVNELWLADNVAVKNMEAKKLFPQHFQPKICQGEEVISLAKEVFLPMENEISEFEKHLIISKIIESSEFSEDFKKLEKNVKNLITIIDSVRLFPTYAKRFESLTREDSNYGIFLVKELAEKLLTIYHNECKKLNFIDEIELRVKLSNINTLNLDNYDRIVIYGNFLAVNELNWKIMLNYCSANSKEIIFVSPIASLLENFYQKRNFIEFQDDVKNFFYSEQDLSLENMLKEFNSEKITYTKFADWDEELNYIAREIKNDILENRIKPQDIAIYIPKEDVYSYKVEKVFADFELPYRKTYSKLLSRSPLGNFFRWYMGLDFNTVKDNLKLLKSPFCSIYYDDFSVPKGEILTFNDKCITSDLLDITFFDHFWLENILTVSGIEYLNKEEENFKKLEENFKRKVQYDIKRNVGNSEKIEKDYLRAYYYLKYFKQKSESIKSLLPASSHPEDFKKMVFQLLTELKVDQKFLNRNPEVPGYYTSVYTALKNLLEGLNSSLIKINNKAYSLEEYRDFFVGQAENTFYSDGGNDEGIFITELPLISRVSLKKVYQVGMSSMYFPTASAKNAFSSFLELFRPIQVRETQLFTFAELLNKTKNLPDFSFHLSYPVIINNQEDEPSEIFSDINNIKQGIATFSLEQKAFSKSQNAEAMGKSLMSIPENHNSLITHARKRSNYDEWSEYEGFLNQHDEGLLANHTSISQIEEFAMCQMKYYFNQKLRLKKHGKTFKDLDSSLKGNLIHKILEEFYIQAKEQDFFNRKDLLSPESRKLMLDIANSYLKTYEESLNNLYIDKLKQQIIGGLSESGRKTGILLEVLEHDQDRMKTGWIPSRFEMNFDTVINELNFKGIIDRVDEHESKAQFDVIDYKTGNVYPLDKEQDIFDGLSYQLTIYAEAFKSQTGKELHQAGYYLLKKADDEDKVSFAPVVWDKEESDKSRRKPKYGKDELITTSLKNLDELKGKILNSEYNYTTQQDQEKLCSYCDYKTICRYNQEKAILFTKNPKINNAEELNLDFVNMEGFTFPAKDNNAKPELTTHQEKALDTSRNIIVTAGAGAGKTEVLTKRMNKLIEETEGNIEKILVITFTRKATAEMQNRIYSSLIKTLDSTSYQGNKSFTRKAKLNFRKNWISTIDAFYLRLLRENLLELDLDMEIEISEQKDLLVLINDTVEKKLDELASLRDPDLNRLLEVWHRDRLIEVLNELINVDWITDFINNDKDLPKKYLEIYIKQTEIFQNKLNELDRGLGVVSSRDHNSVKKYINECRRLITFFRDELNKVLKNPEEYIYDAFACFTKGYRFPPYTEQVKEIISIELHNELIEYLKPKLWIAFFLISAQHIRQEQDFLGSLISVLKAIKQDYDKVKQERNIYTFNDVGKKLYDLLKYNEFARKKIASKFDFIMIDEFQDTNTYQYEIAKYLSGWDGKTLESINKNKLFFVGDEKQAIYQFRGGDVQVFNKAKDEMRDININYGAVKEHVAFPDNFRSSNKLVDFFNHFFANVLAPEGKKKIYEAEHQDLIGHKPDGSINFFLFNKGMLKDKSLRQNLGVEAKFIASTVKKILQFNQTEEIAILFRTKKQIPLFASELEKVGVNYVIYGGTGFYQNQEIIDLISILSFLFDEKKTLELVGFLRSSFIGMSDAEIMIIKDNFKKGFKEVRPDIYEMIFGKKEGEIIKKGWQNLVCELKTHELIERIVHDSFGKMPIYAASGYRQKMKNIERLIEIAKDRDDHSLEEFIEYVEFQIEHQIDESNGTIIELGKIKPVQLMTIHKSKGLGFDTVIIADGGGENYKEENENIHTSDLELFNSDEILKEFITFNFYDEKNDQLVTSFPKKLASNLIKKKGEAELKRLLYVAMTRAKHNLIFSASVWAGLDRSENSMVGFIKNYVTQFDETPFKDRFVMETGDDCVNINNVNFKIFNQNYKITTPVADNLVKPKNVSLVDKINMIRKPIFAYSNIKDKPELINQLISNFNDSKIKVVTRKVNGLTSIKHPIFLNGYEAKEIERIKMQRGNTIHKILEHRIDSEEIAKNIIRKNLPVEMLEHALEHYRNIKVILEELKPLIVSDYHELPFLSGQLEGIFDKLVKTSDGWEIWDYKISDTSTEKSITEEAENNYRVQYEIYSRKLKELLSLEEVKYKLLFSNYGIVEIS